MLNTKVKNGCQLIVPADYAKNIYICIYLRNFTLSSSTTVSAVIKHVFNIEVLIYLDFY